ncbi:MAG: leucine-rich repeat domain-containing protein [Candidatus Lokiarchaeota archaeon]
MIDYEGTKIEEKDYKTITSVTKDWGVIGRCEEKPSKDDYDTGYYVKKGKIVYLALSGYTFNKFPTGITELTNLRELKLVANEYKSLPDSLGNLKNLELLNLGFNRLTKLPNTFRNFENLRYLDISDNHFKSFPEVIFELKNLEILNIEGNPIPSSPDEINRLENLRELNIFVTHIIKLPKSILSLKKLRKIKAYMWIEGSEKVYQELKERNVDLLGFESKNSP